MTWLLLWLACADPLDAVLDPVAEAVRLSPAALTLPEHSHDPSHLPAPVLHLSQDALALDARAWLLHPALKDSAEAHAIALTAAQPMALTEGHLPDGQLKGQLISSLFEALLALQQPQVDDASLGGSLETRTLRLRADRALPFITVTQVLFTAGSAGFQDFILELDGQEELRWSMPDLWAPQGSAWRVLLTPEGALLEPDLLVTHPSEAPDAAHRWLPCPQARCDGEALSEALAGLRWPAPISPSPGTAPLPPRLLLSARRDTPWPTVLELLQRVRVAANTHGAVFSLGLLPDGERPQTADHHHLRFLTKGGLSRQRGLVPCDPARELALRGPLPLDTLSARWRGTPPSGALGPSTLLQAWTQVPGGGYAGLLSCHLETPERRQQGDQQRLIRVNAAGELVEDRVEGHVSITGVRWWREVSLRTRGGGSVALSGELEESGEPPPRLDMEELERAMKELRPGKNRAR